jgi:hypothetical protein
MTVICCWFDQSYGRKRITAIADSRAARKINGKWVSLQESTLKILRIRVACHHIDSFDSATGSWTQPYAETQVGLCFAGYCFEALSIAGLFQRCVEQLVVNVTDSATPEPSRLAELLREITERYFQTHSNREEQYVSFLLFGFSQGDGEPWVAKITHTPTELARLAQWESPLKPHSLFTAGDVGQEIAAHVQDARDRIGKHAAGLDQKKFPEYFAYELEMARHYAVDKKYVEDVTLEKVDSAFRETVGGVLQKAELFCLERNSAVLAFCHDDKHHLLDGLPEVAPNMTFASVVERMGR